MIKFILSKISQTKGIIMFLLSLIPSKKSSFLLEGKNLMDNNKMGLVSNYIYNFIIFYFIIKN